MSALRGAAARGFRAVKLKVGGLAEGSEQNDFRRLALVKAAVGDRIRIAFDANQQWSVAQDTHVTGLIKATGDDYGAVAPPGFGPGLENHVPLKGVMVAEPLLMDPPVMMMEALPAQIAEV